MHRAELLNESDYTIIATYQLEYSRHRELLPLAYNMHTLNGLSNGSWNNRSQKRSQPNTKPL